MIWVGAQALVYPVGSFEHGLQIGAEASFVQLKGTRRYNSSFNDLARTFAQARGQTWNGTPDQEVSDSAFIPGLVIGYKLVTKSGFTINPQLAGDVVISDDPTKIIPRLALNVGWSF